jgi:hypothetical protein
MRIPPDTECRLKLPVRCSRHKASFHSTSGGLHSVDGSLKLGMRPDPESPHVAACDLDVCTVVLGKV